MDTTSSAKPKTMAELLPGLSSILSKDSIQTLTAKKQPRQTIAGTRTAEKVAKPLTLAEMRADLLPLKVQSPRMQAQGAPSTKKKNWNSSVKVDGKIVSLTANGQMKNNPVRKVLNFQPKCKTLSNPTMMEETKFNKPELRAKRSLQQFLVRNNVRISGVTSISDTPLVNIPSRNQYTRLNKQNKCQTHIGKENTQLKGKKPAYVVPDSPLSNLSWKSSGDTSFLLNEKEINDQEQKMKILAAKTMPDPPASTPFREPKPDLGLLYPFPGLQNSEDVTYENPVMADAPRFQEDDTAVISLADLLENSSITIEDKDAHLKDVDLLHIMEKATLKQMHIIDNTVASLIKLKKSQAGVLNYLKTLLERQPKSNKLTTVESAPSRKLPKASVIKAAGSPKRPLTSTTAQYAPSSQQSSTSQESATTNTSTTAQESTTAKESTNEPESKPGPVSTNGQESTIEQEFTSETKADEITTKNTPKDELDLLKSPTETPLQMSLKNQPFPNSIGASNPTVVTTHTNDHKHKGNSKNDKLNKTKSHSVTVLNPGDEVDNYDDLQELLISTSKPEDMKNANIMKFEYTTKKFESKLPSYKIPSKKRFCLRKKLLSNSMSNISNNYETPVKSNMSDQALNMYLRMKKQMNFLNTPNIKQRLDMLDSPSITSLNLQNQLDDLYGES